VQTFVQILVSGLTLGAMYSVSTVGLSLLWGAANVLNMAHGVLLTVGAYAAWCAVTGLGLPWFLGFPACALVGAVAGIVLYGGVVRWLLTRSNSAINIVIATFGFSLVVTNGVLRIFGGYPLSQGAKIEGGFFFLGVYVPAQNALIMGAAGLLIACLWFLLQRTRLGRAIRAVAQRPEAAQLMGISREGTYVAVFAISGAFAAVAGTLWSSITTLSPGMGTDPMLKAFVICVAAGLGNVRGALIIAFALGVAEASIQFFVGVRFALPILLLAVIALLVWRPQGAFNPVMRERQ
jgi:branched-chain amino acid transport system permease protein